MGDTKENNTTGMMVIEEIICDMTIIMRKKQIAMGTKTSITVMSTADHMIRQTKKFNPVLSKIKDSLKITKEEDDQLIT